MDSRPLRILYHHRIAADDGMRVHITEIVHALRQQGHIVHMVEPGAPQSAAPEPQPPLPGASKPGADTSGAGALERTADLLRKIMPGAAFEAAELVYNAVAYRRLSHAIRAFKPDVIYERYNLYLLAGLWAKRRYRLPLLMEINSPLARERAEFGNLKLGALARRCEGALWRGADAALPVTHVLAADVALARGGHDGVHVIPNGANLEHPPSAEAVAAVRQRFGFTEKTTVLGFVGFIRAWHGVGWAIEALADLPAHVHLLIVGDGPARADLEQRAEELGVASRVHFTGRAAHDEVPAYMQCFDIALQTASVSYASPLKLFEYMGLGRAVIAPDQPNIREVLTDGDNAALFTPDSAESFRAALTRLCLDDALRSRLGQSALRAVLETPLTWAHNAERIVALARENLAPSGDAGSGTRVSSAPRAEP